MLRKLRKLPYKNSSQGAVLHEGEADLAPPRPTLSFTKQALTLYALTTPLGSASPPPNRFQFTKNTLPFRARIDGDGDPDITVDLYKLGQE